MKANYASEAQELMKKGDKKLKDSQDKKYQFIFTKKKEECFQEYSQAKVRELNRLQIVIKLQQQSLNYQICHDNLKNIFYIGDEAAEAYLKCARCEEASEGTSVGEYYQEAANMKKRTDKHGNFNSNQHLNKYTYSLLNIECIVYLKKAVEFYQHQDRNGTAGKIMKQIAEIYEQEQDMGNAMAAYEEAAKIFSLENNSTSDYLNMQLKVADFQSEEPSTYNKALLTYEEVGKKYSENKLTQGIAGNIFFKSLLLSLATGDHIGCQNHIEEYTNICPPFTNTRQAKLINKLIECFETNNIEEFSQQCFEFNQIIPLDRWQLRILNTSKEHLSKGVNPLGIGGGHDEDDMNAII